MTSQKRMADHELNANSIEVVEAVRPSTIMTTIDSAISHAWTACRAWYANKFSAPAYTNMNYTSTDIVADSHIQSSRPRKDGATTLKRRRVRSGTKLTKSKPSAGDQPRAGRGQLDYTGCVTEEDMQKRIDDYWAPPELGLMKRSENTKPERRPVSTPDEARTSDELNRQPSHRSVSSNYGERISQRLPRASESRASSSSLPAIHRSHTVDSRNRHRTPLKNNGASLEERMNTLLLSTDDEKVPGFLTPSDYMTEKRLKQAKERKQKEREAAIRAAKELRLIRRQPLKPLVESMGSRWEGRVDEARYKSAQEVITTSIGGTELRLKDFQTLLGRAAWLNDEIINSYIEWIVDAANRVAADAPLVYGESANKAPKFIAHNSFFYENLVKKGPSSTERLMKRKKAAGTALLEVDSVFVPICKGAHWTVGVVRPVARTIEYFDSMGGSGHQFTDLMRRWLAFQLGDAYIEEEWKVPRTACAHQSNGYDCGVFVCTNAFCVALGLDTSCYTERDMTQQRRNIAAVLINRGFTGDFDFARRAL